MALPVRSMTLTEAVDTTRSGSAWYFDANGVFQEESTSDTARIDYDPATGNRLGLMAEGASTNLFTYSEDLSNAEWTKSNSTIGTPTAFATNISLDEIVESAGAGYHGIDRNTNLADDTYTVSVLLKRKSGKRRYVYARYTASDGVAVGRYSVLIDLDDGSVVDTDVSGNSTVTDTGSNRVRDMGGGVYRLEITMTGSSGRLTFGSSDTATPSWSASSLIEFAGDITESFYAGGVQLEPLSGASSYIPTTSAQVTRNAETHELVSLDPWYRASGYSVAVQARLRNVTSNQALLALHDGDSENSVTVDLLGSASDPRVIVETGNVAQATIQSADAVSANTDFKVAARIAANDFAASIDGNTAITDTSGDLPPPATTVVLGQSADDTLSMYGWIQDIKFTTELWSDAELATESGTTV